MTVPVPYRIVGLQVIAVVIVAVAMLAVGTGQAVSAVLGGAASVVPNAYFAWATTRRLARRSPGAALREAARRLVGQGLGKLVLSVALLVVVFETVSVEPLGFFSAFIAAYWMALVAPLVADKAYGKR